MNGERLADEVLRLVSEGMPLKDVARRVCISVPRVERIIKRSRKRKGTEVQDGASA